MATGEGSHGSSTFAVRSVGPLGTEAPISDSCKNGHSNVSPHSNPSYVQARVLLKCPAFPTPMAQVLGQRGRQSMHSM